MNSRVSWLALGGPSSGGGLPPAPTRDELLGLDGRSHISFQGLVVDTSQFGRMPWFEACLPWLNPAGRQAAYAAKRAAGDTHAIVTIPDGVALYDEPGQFYTADKFGPLDWTAGNTALDPKLFALIREVITNGFNRVLLYLGGDGPTGWPIAFMQLELLAASAEYRLLAKYCAVVPGWDSVFYGWPLDRIVAFGLRFRQLFTNAEVLALHYSIGHIPIGEGGDDYQPRRAGQDPQQNPGRMTDYDLLIGEYEWDLHRDSTWQILNRLERDYVRPPDQPGPDDPNRNYYLRTPNPRGPWGHCAMEDGEYESVRCGDNFADMIAHARGNDAYLKLMGCQFT